MSLASRDRGRPPQDVATAPASDDVVFDIVFEDGLLFFELSNREATAVTKVTTTFRRPVIAPDGVTDLTALNVFKKIEYMPHGKVIRVFVDSVASYFARRQPNLIHVGLIWKLGKQTRSAQISHDVRIYRDLPYLVGRGDEARRGISLTSQTDQSRR
jgi:hypothetical protein